MKLSDAKWLSIFTPVGWAILGLSVVAILIVLWLFVTGPQRAHEEAAKASAQAISASSRTSASKDAIGVVVGAEKRTEEIDTQSKESRDEIQHAPGADAPVNPAVGDAGRRAVCLRESSRRLPACRKLLDAHP